MLSLLATALVLAGDGEPLAALSGAAAQRDTAAEVVLRAREALGWDRVLASGATLRIEGRAELLGTRARQTMVLDAAGRFVETIEGELPQASGFDGTTAWMRDWNDTPRELALGDRSQVLLGALFLSGRWTAAGDELRFELAPSASEDEVVLAFRHADGIQHGTIALDARTWRARSASYGPDGQATEWRFADHREHEPLTLPGSIEVELEGMTQRLEVLAVARVEDVDDDVFAPRLQAPGDARFDAGLGAALEVRRARSGHLLVHPRIDGRDVGWFLLDTGAGTSCIARSAAQGLVGPVGELVLRGIGGTVPARFWRARELCLGPLVVDEPLFLELDLGFLEPSLGVRVGGVLGFELFARSVVEIDLQEPAVALFDPAAYQPPAGARWQEVLLHGRQPCVRARVEGHEGVFRIDTGVPRDTLTLHYEAVRELRLLEGRATRAGRAGGVGGSVATRTGELASFELGGRAFESLAASFVVEDRGSFSDDYLWGNVGGELLGSFRLVLDHPGRRIGFLDRAAGR